MTIERRRHARSYFNSTKNWVVYDTGKSQLAVQPPPVPPPPPPLPPLASNDGSSSNSRSTVAYRDTARWGKDKMTYEELSVAWDAFNRAEELKAFYFAQSEAVDHLLEQVFQNVRIDCEDLDGLKPPPRPSPSSVSTSKRCKEGCGCNNNNDPLSDNAYAPNAPFTDTDNIDPLDPPSTLSVTNGVRTPPYFINSRETIPRNVRNVSKQ